MIAGIGSYAFRYAAGDYFPGCEEKMGIREILEFCRSREIKALQICDNIPLHLVPEDELGQFSSMAEKYGIVIETGTKGFTSAMLEKYICISALFRSSILRTVLDVGAESSTVDKASGEIKKIIPSLEAHSVTLAVENHFDLNPYELRDFIQEIGHPLVKICIDPLNSITHLSGINETLDLLGEFVVTAHVKDVNVTRKGSSFIISGCPLGEGRAEVEKYIGQVYRINSSCNVFLEQWMDPLENREQTLREEKEQVEAGIDYLTGIINKLKITSEKV